MEDRHEDWKNEKWKEMDMSRDRKIETEAQIDIKNNKMDRHTHREIHRWINMKNMTLNWKVFANIKFNLC